MYIENETIIMYALKDDKENYYSTSGMLKDVHPIISLKEAKEIQKIKPEFSKIRKIKIIDIGEIL